MIFRPCCWYRLATYVGSLFLEINYNTASLEEIFKAALYAMFAEQARRLLNLSVNYPEFNPASIVAV
ncbi:MAG: hypothetical protein GY820_10170 [Gammaproteobacteria bacterium]|nr:hypothetical protein [Gammaproteobacteria bacterium]